MERVNGTTDRRSKEDSETNKRQGLVSTEREEISAKRGQQDRSNNSESDHRKYACVWSSDIDKYARQIYKKNFGEEPEGDITKIPADSIPDHDLLCAGFPCQAFSIAGKRKGFQDTRGTLFFDITRILSHKRPRYFLLENVDGLLSDGNGKTFQTILRVLTDIGYLLQSEVLNSKNYSVPQSRKRVFIVGHLRGERRPEIFPIGKDAGFCNKEKNTRQENNSSDKERCIGDNQAQLLKFLGEKSIKVRRLTPIECERLQGFPDNWTALGIDQDGKQVKISDAQRYKVLGNAVSVPVIEFLGRRLLDETYL